MIRSALDISAVGHPDHEGTVPLAVCAIVEASDFVEKLVHARPEIVGKLDLSNRLNAIDERHPQSNTNDCRFCKRRIKTSFNAVLGCQATSDAKNASLAMSDVFTEDNNEGIFF